MLANRSNVLIMMIDDGVVVFSLFLHNQTVVRA